MSFVSSLKSIDTNLKSEVTFDAHKRLNMAIVIRDLRKSLAEETSVQFSIALSHRPVADAIMRVLLRLWFFGLECANQIDAVLGSSYIQKSDSWNGHSVCERQRLQKEVVLPPPLS